MQQFRKIGSILILSIFSGYLLHKLLPHVHHEHGSTQLASIATTEHSHAHDHHHHHDDDDTSEGFDLLGFLLGAHTHTVQVDNMLVAKRHFKQQVTAKVFITNVLFTNELWDIEAEGQVVWQHPPDPTKSPHLASISLRGPPAIG